MNVKSFLFTVVLIGGSVGFANADPVPAGPFGPPYNENQSWQECGSSGWIPYGDPDSHQYHMQYYTAAGKYHMGEDWNGQPGACNGNSDEGAPLIAIAGGEVVFLDDIGTVSGQGKRLYIRHSFPYTYAAGDVMTFDVAMLHLQGMGSGLGTGSMVAKGQTVAYLGKTGTISAHLHWEAQTDLAIPLGINPYQNPLTISHALKYRPPSLIVDDRRDENVYAASAGRYTIFTMFGNAPSSTAYIEWNGERKSFKKAIEAGWMRVDHVAFKDNGSWYYYYDVDYYFFEDGHQYAVSSHLNSATLHIPVPRNNFQEDRARLDMIRAVEHDSGYVSIRTETYTYHPNYYPNHDLHFMALMLKDGRMAYVYQATHKYNPLIRYTSHYQTAMGAYTGWVPINPNQLY